MNVESRPFFDISPATVEAAARERFGPDVELGPAYWLDDEVMRFPVSLDKGNGSFGANFHFREGKFR